jgi:hypothetical protein
MDEKGNELIARNADKPFVPASVTKIVTRSWPRRAQSAPTRRGSTLPFFFSSRCRIRDDRMKNDWNRIFAFEQ